MNCFMCANFSLIKCYLQKRNHLLEKEDKGYGRGGYQDDYYSSDTSGHGAPSGGGAHYGHDDWYSNSSPMGSPSKEPNYKDSINRFAPAPTTAGPSYEEDYENEPPLLEELGIRMDHIWSKTQAVIVPFKPLSEHILDDADLAGPLLFCLILGSLCLLAGKIHFGYIFGFGLFGCVFMYAVINLLDERGLDFWLACSALGYCLIPVLVLAAVNVVLSLKGYMGLCLALATITWSTVTSTRLFDARLHLYESGQYWLVAYPVALLYGCFVLITIY